MGLLNKVKTKTLDDGLSLEQFKATYIPYLLVIENVSLERATELVPRLYEDCARHAICTLGELKDWLQHQHK